MDRGRVMHYEAGMTIVFDVLSKSVLIVFRDKIITLPGPYSEQQTAVLAAEQHRRTLGWGTSPL
jgi:hypothetical protein